MTTCIGLALVPASAPSATTPEATVPPVNVLKGLPSPFPLAVVLAAASSPVDEGLSFEPVADAIDETLADPAKEACLSVEDNREEAVDIRF